MSNARQLAASATSLTDLSDNSISGAFDVGSLTIGGTEVIDSSRNLSNIAGGFKTVNGTSVVGSGDISAGASTAAGDVGTYVQGLRGTGTSTYSTTYAGSGINPSSTDKGFKHSGTLSGTWRCMGYSEYGTPTVWVRIS